MTVRSDATPVCPNVNALTRREIVLSGLLGMVASLASPAIASPQAVDIPTFESGRYQFTIIRPQRELPSIRLFRLEGGTIDLSSLRGKPILLNFWASWCAACRTELPILERQYRSVWRNNLHVIAVSQDRSSRETIEHFVKALAIQSVPICLDPNGYVAYSDSANERNAPFALYGMPITYVIASSGWVVGYMPGAQIGRRLLPTTSSNTSMACEATGRRCPRCCGHPHLDPQVPSGTSRLFCVTG